MSTFNPTAVKCLPQNKDVIDTRAKKIYIRKKPQMSRHYLNNKPHLRFGANVTKTDVAYPVQREVAQPCGYYYS